MLAQQINSAPPPGQKTKSTYPRYYHNQEGPRGATTPNFHAGELRQGAELHEYPIKRANEQAFDFDRRTASVRQVERPVHPNDRSRVARNPPNDPGPIRGVVDQHRNIAGAMAHPVGDVHGH